jgi:tRNA dimethylallyltransferase
MSVPDVLVVLGPTAVGKTAVSLELAEALQAEIISADSRLFYRNMDIGTAKPDQEYLHRIPHHLIDVSDPDDTWSLERYIEAATELIKAIHQRGHLPMLVGGTGQYLRGLLDGWRPPPKAPDDSIRNELRAVADEEGPIALHDRLRAIDPVSAERIDFRNVRRVVRALEVYQLTGEPFSSQRKTMPPDFNAVRIGLTRPRKELYARIDARIDEMFEAGWLEEVRGLMKAGYGLQHPSMSAIGYQQLVEHLQGKLSLEQAVAEIRRLTRQYVRRQANWFKADDPSIHWFEVEIGVVDRILELLERKYNLLAKYSGSKS